MPCLVGSTKSAGVKKHMPESFSMLSMVSTSIGSTDSDTESTDSDNSPTHARFSVQKSPDFAVPPAIAARAAILALEMDRRESSGRFAAAAA
jgi:hypothetical protein